jgi:hypothetical protein
MGKRPFQNTHGASPMNSLGEEPILRLSFPTVQDHFHS